MNEEHWLRATIGEEIMEKTELSPLEARLLRAKLTGQIYSVLIPLSRRPEVNILDVALQAADQIMRECQLLPPPQEVK